MNQQNSTNFSPLEKKTLNFTKNGQFQLIKLLDQDGNEALFDAQPTNNNNSQLFAIRIYKAMSDQEKSLIRELIDHQEKNDNDPIKTSGIIRIYETGLFSNFQTILMERGESNLYDYIQKNENISMDKRIEICTDLFKSIKFMNSKGIFHKQIRPESFILIENKFKLINFWQAIKGQDSKKHQIKDFQQILYQAPEILNQKPDFLQSVDTWSLGCVIYWTLAGKSFFVSSEIEDLKNKIKDFKDKETNQYYLKRIDSLSVPSYVKENLKSMLEYKRYKRIKIADVQESFTNKLSPGQQNNVVQPQGNPPINPLFQTQIIPNIQNKTNLQFQPQMNQVLQPPPNSVQSYQQQFQQPNQPIQFKQPTQLQAAPFPQQNIQHQQQLSSGHIEQVCQLLLGEIKKQICQNQQQQIVDRDGKNEITESGSIQYQNNVEDAFNEIVRIMQNLNDNVQAVQTQQIEDIKNEYEQKLEQKTQEIDQLIQQLKNTEQQQQFSQNHASDQNNMQLQGSASSLNAKLQEQPIITEQQPKDVLEKQNLEDLVNEVIKRFEEGKQLQEQDKQQQLPKEQDYDIFMKLYQTLQAGLNNF
ncbi:unnamed protein product (macronuclear) [Paramecium tetraurelia]|uniref:Protein kinase domain-containing protein n=1 Tax=Paramecium tetraurelia TaxID=5888 RepID=A0DKL8_PARTE|nr:uncharacterized protein GSPATT00017915001 [Paramecium tetraurelia]CAK83585.1 unnamed protein product [Paramecium tetraurelia]|eukprot:XP_001450982.1 hypothetical protein (macronuclear) [Paramecium tetraurelia strain d4-2]